MMGDLIALQRELDENEFTQHLKFFSIKYSKFPDCESFLKYFNSYYVERKEMWASCYRKEAGINTNMHLESLHKWVSFDVGDCGGFFVTIFSLLL